MIVVDCGEDKNIKLRCLCRAVCESLRRCYEEMKNWKKKKTKNDSKCTQIFFFALLKPTRVAANHKNNIYIRAARVGTRQLLYVHSNQINISSIFPWVSQSLPRPSSCTVTMRDARCECIQNTKTMWLMRACSTQKTIWHTHLGFVDKTGCARMDLKKYIIT